MNVLILYYSKGGNTRKLAEAITEGVGQVDGVETVLRHTRDVSKDDFVAADGLIVGSPVYFGTMAAQLKQVLDEFVGVRRKMENKVGAAFSTSGDASGGTRRTSPRSSLVTGPRKARVTCRLSAGVALPPQRRTAERVARISARRVFPSGQSAKNTRRRGAFSGILPRDRQ